MGTNRIILVLKIGNPEEESLERQIITRHSIFLNLINEVE